MHQVRRQPSNPCHVLPCKKKGKPNEIKDAQENLQSRTENKKYSEIEKGAAQLAQHAALQDFSPHLSHIYIVFEGKKYFRDRPDISINKLEGKQDGTIVQESEKETKICQRISGNCQVSEIHLPTSSEEGESDHAEDIWLHL